jgi:hypothetical protein
VGWKATQYPKERREKSTKKRGTRLKGGGGETNESGGKKDMTRKVTRRNRKVERWARGPNG